MFYVEELRNTGQADYSQGIAHHAKVAGEKWSALSESGKQVRDYYPLCLPCQLMLTHFILEIP
jgi:hypothetical protein